MKLGIPRGLFYYRFHPTWKAFFEELGAELVLSPPTNRAVLELGVKYALPESCAPLKLFTGHVCSLIGQVDMLFVPSFHRFAQDSANCAKLIGLPNLLQATVPDLPPLISPDIDLSQSNPTLLAQVLREGVRFSWNPMTLREAFNASWQHYIRTREDLQAGRLTPAGFEDAVEDHLPARKGLQIAVVGHPYNLYDMYFNHNLLARLDRLGVQALTPEILDTRPAIDYWAFEYEILGASRLALERKDLEGIIAVVAFGCVADGMMVDKVQRLAAEDNVPVMILTLDEHSGEAGLVTRLEAFVDMVNWRKKSNGKNLSGN